MSDLDFRILADSKELDNLLTDISSLKTSLVNLEDVNRAVNTSFKAVTTSIDAVSSGLASASAQAKQLHTDLGYIIGDINKIDVKGGLLGDISGVRPGPPLGQAFHDLPSVGSRSSGFASSAGSRLFGDLGKFANDPASAGTISREDWARRVGVDLNRANAEADDFLNTISEVINRTQNLPSENWLEYKRFIDETDESLDQFLADLALANTQMRDLPSMPTSSPINARYDARRAIANTPYMGRSFNVGDASDAVLQGLTGRDTGLGAGSVTGLGRDYLARAVAAERGGRDVNVAGLGRTREELDQIHNRGRKATLAIVELSRGAEDAAVTFGTGGLAGALRASINNFSQFAFIIHPMAGAVAGVAGALTAVLIPALTATDDEARKAEQSLKQLTSSMYDFERARISGRELPFTGKETVEQLQQQQLVGQFRNTNRGDMWRLLGQEVAGHTVKLPGVGPQGSDALLSPEDLRDFFDAASRAGATPGQSVLRDFTASMEGKYGGAIDEEGQKFLAEKLNEIQKMYLEMEQDSKRNAELEKELVGARLRLRDTLDFQNQLTETELMDKEDARKARNRDRMTSLISGLVDQGDPEARMRRELREQLNVSNNVNSDPAFVNGLLNQSFNVRTGLTKRQKEIDEQIESLEGRDPLNSLAGKLTGLTELNRRITESAAGIKDPTVEQLKGLREERKKAAEEAKKELEKINEKLAAQLNEREQREVGLLGP